MSYHHTQHGRFHWLFYGIAAALVPLVYVARQEWPAAAVTGFVIVVMVVCGLSFHRLTVKDEGDYLALRYGPLPALRKNVFYEHVTSAKVGRSSLIDGWGIHYIPWRGWTYNLWGFDCVELAVRERTRPGTMRIGTDDAAALAAFIRSKISTRADNG